MFGYRRYKEKTTKNTAGIIIVHMAGYISSDIDEIRDYCDKNNLFLIEDAAHTPGAEVNNVNSGNFGHIGCFSFYPTKILTSGEEVCLLQITKILLIMHVVFKIGEET